MDRYLKIGERYVQWLALGLGVLYLTLMAFLYIFSTPLTVKIGGQECTPGTVETVIASGDNQKIKSALDAGPPPWLSYSLPNPSLVVQRELGGTKQDVQLAHVPLPPVKGTPTGPRETGPKTRLPDMPAPTVAAGGPSLGTSIITAPSAGAPAVAAAPAPAGGAGAAAVPVIAESQQLNVDWVSHQWNLDLNAMYKAVVDAHIQKVLMKGFYILKVELQREEMKDGVWTNRVTMPPMAAELVTPMPMEKAPDADKQAYLNWAAAHQGLIRRPPFPTVVSGTQWYDPGAPPKDADPFAPAPAPAPGGVAPPAVPAPPGPGALPMVRPGGPESGFHRQVQPFSRAGTAEGAATGGTDAGADDINLLPESDAPADGSQPPVAPPAGVAAVAPQFGTISFLTHDWTVEQNRTYRFRIRYSITNTMYGQTAPTIPHELTTVMALVSPFSEWSPSVAIPTRFRVFVREYKPKPIAGQPSSEVTFDVFVKRPEDKIGLTRDAKTCTPGDQIGDSGWTFVDVRKDPTKRLAEVKNQYFFLVADPNGRIHRRDLERDQKDVNYTTLRDRTGGTTALSVP